LLENAAHREAQAATHCLAPAGIDSLAQAFADSGYSYVLLLSAKTSICHVDWRQVQRLPI